MNSALEFHDSVLFEIRREEGAAVFVLRPAYVHKSTGEPGVDEGTGWSLDLEVFLWDAALSFEGGEPNLPARISDGRLDVGDRAGDNAVPLPPASRESASMVLDLETGQRISVYAKGIESRELGEATFIERFPGGPRGPVA